MSAQKRGGRLRGPKKSHHKQKKRPGKHERQGQAATDDAKLNKSLKKLVDKAKSDTKQALSEWFAQSDKIAHSPHAEVDVEESLDPWQHEAYNGLLSGENIVVDAPTTAGKTRVVEAFFIKHVDDPGFRAAYTTPVKSLSNDKVREFRAMFGKDKIGIATGDIKENLHAPIVVTTLETYRNSLLGVEPDLHRKLVIFDEYHFMQDISRGSAWEEAIILTPHTCQLLLLSASVANARDFCNWLEAVHEKPCRLVRTTHRPVPLTNLVYFKKEWLLADKLPQKAFRRPKSQPYPLPHKHLAERLSKIVKLNLTPCIIYAGRRLSCESIAIELSKVVEPLTPDEKDQLKLLLQKEHEESQALSFIPHNLRRLIQSYGIAYHHSGLPAPVRVAIEHALKQGLLRFCSATMGLSLGINFSVRSAIISDYTRPGEHGLTRYGNSEVMQMLGRAGRRGRDAVGFSLWASAEYYAVLAKTKREKCESQLKNDPTTFLGLISQGRSLREIEKFYGRSFRRFGDTGIDLSLITRKRVTAKLDTTSIPCQSPAHAYGQYVSENPKALCRNCKFRPACHRYLEAKIQNDLAALHLHLHAIGALNEKEQLTHYGEVAKYFPQTGGLVVADMIANGVLNENNLTVCAELMAAVCLAKHKRPNIAGKYRFPFDPDELEAELEYYYPVELFPELYDTGFRSRDEPALREFNPDAGYIVKEWLQGITWKELEHKVTTEKFAAGDLMSLIYRVASYMQSLSQAHLGEVSRYAREYREQLLRPPLSITL